MACPEEGEKNNYFVINSVTKCSENCMTVYYTLYIYCCSYEDMLIKISNIPRNVKYEITTKTSIKGDDTIYIVCQQDWVSIDISNDDAKGEATEFVYIE
jgi:hypothetical protein